MMAVKVEHTGLGAAATSFLCTASQFLCSVSLFAGQPWWSRMLQSGTHTNELADKLKNVVLLLMVLEAQ